MATSEMSRSGCSDRNAANASSGVVKHFAEKPLMLRIAVRVDAMTGSSSTTKIRSGVREGTWSSFPKHFALHNDSTETDENLLFAIAELLGVCM